MILTNNIITRFYLYYLFDIMFYFDSICTLFVPQKLRYKKYFFLANLWHTETHIVTVGHLKSHYYEYKH